LQDREFVSAQAPDIVRIAGHVPEPGCDCTQHLVAGCMAEGVVDLLEQVEVDQVQDRETVRASICYHTLVELFVEGPAVQQSGQLIGACVSAYGFLVQVTLMYILRNAHEADMHSGAIEKRCQFGFDPTVAACAYMTAGALFRHAFMVQRPPHFALW